MLSWAASSSCSQAWARGWADGLPAAEGRSWGMLSTRTSLQNGHMGPERSPGATNLPASPVPSPLAKPGGSLPTWGPSPGRGCVGWGPNRLDRAGLSPASRRGAATARREQGGLGPIPGTALESLGAWGAVAPSGDLLGGRPLEAAQAEPEEGLDQQLHLPGGDRGPCPPTGGQREAPRGAALRAAPAPPILASRAHSPAGVLRRLQGLPSRGLPGPAGPVAPGPAGPFLGAHLAAGGRKVHLPQDVGKSHGAEPQRGQHSQHLQLEKASPRGPWTPRVRPTSGWADAAPPVLTETVPGSPRGPGLQQGEGRVD